MPTSHTPTGEFGMEQRLGAVLHDDIDEEQPARQYGQDNRLVDQEIGEGDVAQDRRGEDDHRQDPAQRPRRRPGVGLRRSGGVGGRPGEAPKQAGDHERHQRRAQPTRGHRNVERGDRVGGGLDQTLHGPDRRDRHAGAGDHRGGTIADRNDPPGRVVRREHRRGQAR